MKFHSPSETGEILHLSANQVRKLILAGRLRAIDVGTGGRHHWRIPESALDEFSRGKGNEPHDGLLDDEPSAPK